MSSDRSWSSRLSQPSVKSIVSFGLGLDLKNRMQQNGACVQRGQESCSLHTGLRCESSWGLPMHNVKMFWRCYKVIPCQVRPIMDLNHFNSIFWVSNLLKAKQNNKSYILSIVKSFLGSSSLTEQTIAQGGLCDVQTPSAPEVCVQQPASTTLSYGSIP